MYQDQDFWQAMWDAEEDEMRERQEYGSYEEHYDEYGY